MRGEGRAPEPIGDAPPRWLGPVVVAYVVLALGGVIYLLVRWPGHRTVPTVERRLERRMIRCAARADIAERLARRPAA
jgi:hypothetical protein